MLFTYIVDVVYMYVSHLHIYTSYYTLFCKKSCIFALYVIYCSYIDKFGMF